MTCFILSALFGAVCMTLIFCGADAVDWTRFKFWVGEMWEKLIERLKRKSR